MFCKYCGKQIDDDAVFCSSCGKKVADANAQVNSQTVMQNTQQTNAESQTQSNVEKSQQSNRYNDDATAQLFDAVQSMSVDKVKQLIADGANVNIIDRDGWTPLMFASYCTLEIVQTLLAAGAAADIKSKVGHTALSLAQDNRTSDKDAIIALLQQHENGSEQPAQEQAKTTWYTEINQQQAASINMEQTTQNSHSAANTLETGAAELKKMNSLVIASVVLLFMSFFLDFYGIFKYTALILAVSGNSQIQKGKGTGKTPAIVCIAVSALLSFISVVRIINYARYEAAAYGAVDGLLYWLGDLLRNF